VTVRFGKTVALEEASMAVFPGDTVAILGPDGAGKSTLLRVMAGLTMPTAGRVTAQPERSALGYAGAQFDLYGDLTVAENLRFFGTLRGMGQARLQARTDAMLDLTGLQDARDRLAGRLSGGMKKKLSLACALVHEPALLLLDEPTVGVDPVSRQELWDVVMTAVAAGTATVFTSCYLEEASYATRLAAMAGGRLVETTAERVMAESAGWWAWVAPVPEDRTEVRCRLAEVEHEPRVYLRPEGLAALATDEEAARTLLATTVGEGFSTGDLVRSGLTFEDAFVLMEVRNRRGGLMSEAGTKAGLFRSVVFDFDYTLVDSSPGVIDCVNHALHAMGLPAAEAKDIRATIGMPLAEVFEKLAGHGGAGRFAEFERLFVARGDEVMLQSVRLLDPVRPAVEALLEKGVTLGIVSSKYHRRIEAVLEREGLSEAFAVIVGSDDIAACKPDPSGLLLAIRMLERTPAEVLYVGDSTIDAEAAQRAGTEFAAVLTGVTPREAFAGYEPRAFMDDLTVLPGMVLTDWATRPEAG
jgi:HAD superfamily hydrolase (TIGR01509 family)